MFRGQGSLSVLGDGIAQENPSRGSQGLTTSRYHCEESGLREEPYMLLTAERYYSHLQREGPILMNSFRKYLHNTATSE